MRVGATSLLFLLGIFTSYLLFAALFEQYAGWCDGLLFGLGTALSVAFLIYLYSRQRVEPTIRIAFTVVIVMTLVFYTIMFALELSEWQWRLGNSIYAGVGIVVSLVSYGWVDQVLEDDVCWYRNEFERPFPEAEKHIAVLKKEAKFSEPEPLVEEVLRLCDHHIDKLVSQGRLSREIGEQVKGATKARAAPIVNDLEKARERGAVALPGLRQVAMDGAGKVLGACYQRAEQARCAERHQAVELVSV